MYSLCTEQRFRVLQQPRIEFASTETGSAWYDRLSYLQTRHGVNLDGVSKIVGQGAVRVLFEIIVISCPCQLTRCSRDRLQTYRFSSEHSDPTVVVIHVRAQGDGYAEHAGKLGGYEFSYTMEEFEPAERSSHRLLSIHLAGLASEQQVSQHGCDIWWKAQNEDLEVLTKGTHE